MPISQSPTNDKRPSKVWWLFAVVVFVGFVLVQLPMAWIVQRFVPNTPYVQWISGNLWQGSATWQLPQTSTKKPLNGNLVWQWRPVKLFLGKFSADIKISTGSTRLAGEASISLGSSWQLQDLSGRIQSDTLASFVDWQLPDTPIQVNGISLSFDKTSGFKQADGQLTWVGGQLGYPNAGQIYQLDMPAIRADISSEKKENQQVLHAHLVNQENKSLGDLYVDKQGMLDISLTQRLLENMPTYHGSAPKDTAVVSVRQPITSLNE